MIPASGTTLMRLLQLASPALPIGAFAYSQGLETAVATGWVRDEATARQWIQGLADHGLATLEVPVLLRLMEAWMGDDRQAVQRWNDFYRATRGAAELRAEDEHLGGALARVLHNLQVADAADWLPPSRTSPPCYVAMFALAAVRWQVPANAACCTLLFTWAEAQVSAATRLVPLGQSESQRILFALGPSLEAAAQAGAHVPDDGISTGAIIQPLASALHETQYSRLFRS